MKTSPMIRAALLTGIAFGSMTALPTLAFAQDEAADEAESGEIIVTARRREENLQDVPIAITAYTADDLAQSGAIDITAISETTPNVTL